LEYERAAPMGSVRQAAHPTVVQLPDVTGRVLAAIADEHATKFACRPRAAGSLGVDGAAEITPIGRFLVTNDAPRKAAPPTNDYAIQPGDQTLPDDRHRTPAVARGSGSRQLQAPGRSTS
jgi:hypothetical protein